MGRKAFGKGSIMRLMNLSLVALIALVSNALVFAQGESSSESSDSSAREESQFERDVHSLPIRQRLPPSTPGLRLSTSSRPGLKLWDNNDPLGVNTNQTMIPFNSTYDPNRHSAYFNLTQEPGEATWFGNPPLFEDDGVSCRNPNIENEAVLDAINWSSCFENRVSESSHPGLPSKEYIKRDLDVCTCLRTSKLQAVVDKMTSNYVRKEGREKMVPEAEHISIMSALAVQTRMIYLNQENPPRGDNLIKKIAGYSAALYLNDDEKLSFRFDPPEKLMRDIGPFNPNVCITPSEFFMASMAPDEGVVSELQREYSDKLWDYRELENEYRSLMRLSVKERARKSALIRQLKQKLKFLNRNPVIKYVLGAQGEEASRLKKEVSSLLKKLKSPDCRDLAGKCYKDYIQGLGSLMDRPGTRELVRNEARRDHGVRTARKTAGIPLTERVGEVSQRSIIAEFRRHYRLNDPQSYTPEKCTSNPRMGNECLEAFSGYCHTLDKYKPHLSQLRENISLKIQDDLDDDLMDAFNPDIQNNQEYKNFVAANCDGPRYSNLVNSSNFENFIKKYCSKDSQRQGCPLVEGKISSAEALGALRKAWLEEFPNSGRFGLGDTASQKVARGFFANIFKAPGLNSNEINALRSENSPYKVSSEAQVAAGFNEANANDGLEEVIPTVRRISSQPTPEEVAPTPAGSQSTDEAHSQKAGDSLPQESPDSRPMTYANYSQGAVPPQELPEDRKIENMPQEAREELLQDWQKEYEELKRARDEGEASPQQLARESALKDEIAALRQLLTQQQDLNQKQYKMLNEAIAAKAKAPLDSQDLTPTSASPSRRTRQESQIASGPGEISEEVRKASRAPSSVDQKPTPTPQSGGAGSVRASSQSRRAFSTTDSADSVAREEAKLVNLRRFSDGSITIESGSQGSGAGGVNAISVPVSDEQYRQLQVNPTGLNLGQIEGNIPQDQIAKLEKNGEITIILRNGSNPPFEVKVEKKNNRLVYSLKDREGKDQLPIRRVFTRQALELELKAQR